MPTLLIVGCVLASACHHSADDASSKSTQPVGTRATAMLTPVPDAPVPMARDGEAGNGRSLGSQGAPITGTAKFTVTPDGVDLWMNIRGCNAASIGYAVEIHEGTTCAAENLTGPIWNAPRGEGIAPLYCRGASGTGDLFYSRLHSDKQPWRVGGSGASDVVGHVLVIRDPDLGDAPLACGVVAFDPHSTLDAGVSPAERAPIAARASVAGICLVKMLAGADAGSGCPDPQALVDCATIHCDLGTCLGQCAEYVSCLAGQAGACSFACPPSTPCSQCMSQLTPCEFGYCTDQLSCAPPITPGGPCTKVESCCHTQGDFEAPCLDIVHKLEKVSGDASCIGVQGDWDFNTHLSVPCKWD